METEKREETYRFYLTDALKMIAENTARLGGGTMPTMRYYEVAHPAPVEKRTADEVISDIRKRLKGG